MSERYPGGYIQQTPPTLNPALGNAAPGVWTMDQVLQARQAGTWPAYDPYFKNTTLLLHGNGTNGAQNNTFLDSSTNNFTITRNGNSTQGTFSPFSQPAGYWSNYFDGSSALYAAYNASLNVGNTTGSGGTVEFFYYATSLTSPRSQLFGVWAASSGWTVDLDTNGDVFLAANGAGVTYTYGFTANTWNYCQFVFGNFGSGFVCKGYLNGVLKFTSSVLTHTNNNQAFYIGRRSDNTLPCNGYFSNFRVNTNNNLSTSIPTAPLTAVSGTSLLTCQSNRFVDNSTNAFSLTTVGTPSIQAFSPFAPTAAYSASTVGGSGYFDGTGDSLTAPNNTAFDFGSGNFTVEGWYYMVAGAETASNGRWIVSKWGLSDSTTSWGFRQEISGGAIGKLRFYCYFGGALTTLQSTANQVINTWYHVAAVRNGSTLTMYINGISDASATVSGSVDVSTTSVGIGTGQDSTTSNPKWFGYLSEVRVVKGTAVYTANFTPPTAPLTAITNTQLLLNYTNAGIIDNTAKNDLETVGDVKISTAQSKFGGSSMYFDGSGDYLKIPASKNLDIVGDFTIEMWVYPTAATTYRILLDSSANGTAGATMNEMWLYPNGAGCRLDWYVAGAVILTGATVISLNTWTHIAVSRSGNSTKSFVNGVVDQSVTTVYTPSVGYPWYVGDRQAGAGSGQYPYAGYIDDLRITKGYARYTANFTPQTSQWQDQ